MTLNLFKKHKKSDVNYNYYLRINTISMHEVGMPFKLCIKGLAFLKEIAIIMKT